VREGELWVPGTLPTDVPSQMGSAEHFLQTRVIGDGRLSTMHEIQVGNERCPAVLTKQDDDGSFKVTAFKRDERDVFQPLQFQAVHRSNIFLTATGQNIEIPELEASLDIPSGSPQQSNVTIDGEDFAFHLGRVSPPVSTQPRRITVNVPKPVYKDAKQRAKDGMLGKVGLPIQQETEPVRIDASVPVLEHFLSGEVRRGDMVSNRLQKDWILQLGPFATHTVRLIKKSHVNPVMTVVVDGEVLVECLATDLLGGDANTFRCKFSFIGERIMDFCVFEETKDGFPLHTKSVVTKPYQYRHSVELTYSHKAVDHLKEARMMVDGIPFESLPCLVIPRADQEGLSVVRTALEAQFPIQIPKKIVPEDTRYVGLQLGQSLVEKAGGWNKIGEDASVNMSAAADSLSTTMKDMGTNLQKLGLSAWEMMFLQKDADGPVEARHHSGSISEEGGVRQPVRSMATRSAMNGYGR
jgi:hypothetical protein